MFQTYLFFLKNTTGWDLDSITYQFCNLGKLFKILVLMTSSKTKIGIVILPITYCIPLYILAEIHVCKWLCKYLVHCKCTTNSTEEDEVVDHNSKNRLRHFAFPL